MKASENGHPKRAAPQQPASSQKLRVTAVNPLDYASEIKSFVSSNGWSGFPEFFDRAYPAAVEDGAMSWIGLDTTERIIMHWACFPIRFRFGSDECRAGLMANLMVAERHRSFFPARRLMSRAVRDLRSGGGFDFLYGVPTKPAEALMRSVGFESIDRYGRFVLPIAGRRWYTNLAARTYGSLLHLARGLGGATVIRHPAADVDLDFYATPPAELRSLQAFHPPRAYQCRLKDFPGEHDHWFSIQQGGAGKAALGAALVRGPGSDALGRARLLCTYRTRRVRVSRLLAALIPELQAIGCMRLQAWGLVNSAFGQEIKRAGFSLRDGRPAVTLPITARGQRAVTAHNEWDISYLDVDA